MTALSLRTTSDAMRRLDELVSRVANGNISVLILGETGVGKEVLAETIHRRSRRADKPFVRLNCAALSESLLESELFGHEKGAFTGAVATKLGLLESAQHGTVFLDEIGEMPMATQVKLLRVLEQRELLRVGGTQTRGIDVRFVSATHRDLKAEIHAGRFRRDLYFRIDGITLVVPPLRERLIELEALARHFVERAAASMGMTAPELAAEALAALRTHGWPGNIRELRNVMERAVLLASERIGVEHVLVDPFAPCDDERSLDPAAPTPGRRSNALDRDQVVAALARAAGNQKLAAELLGVSRRTLINKLIAFEIARPRKRTTSIT